MANYAVILSGLVFLLASVASRAHVLLGWSGLRNAIDVAFLLAGGAASLVFLVRRPLWGITLGATYLLVLADAYCSLFWPSLKPGIPVQDYLLADHVSSNYSWDQAFIYLKTSGVMLALGLAARMSWSSTTAITRRVFHACVIAAIALNVFVVGIQGAVDIHWLAASSGTAIEHGRAAGLLEDSGASTVYMAAVVAGLLFMALFGHMPRSMRAAVSVATVVSAAVSAWTGGMVYFLSVAVSSLVALGLYIHWWGSPARWKRAVVLLALAAAGVSAVFIHAITHPGAWLHGFLLALDPIRLVHQKVMLWTFLEQPWLGTGFGMFYANLAVLGPAAARMGGVVFSDVPTSLYLMLLSELGLAGGLMIAAGLGWVGSRVVRLIPPVRTGRAAPWAAFAAGASVSLAISLTVGIHVIFWSVPALAIPIVVGGAPDGPGKRRWLAPVWAAALLIIAVACVKLWATAPRAPEFRWKERGTPQIPLSLVVPIWPEGLEGIWAASGAEFLFEGKPLWFHVERPAEFYPMTLTIQVFDRSGRVIATNEQRFDAPTGADPGRLIQAWFPDDVNTVCSTGISPDAYCSFRITTTPAWTLGTQAATVLYVTRNLR